MGLKPPPPASSPLLEVDRPGELEKEPQTDPNMPVLPDQLRRKLTQAQALIDANQEESLKRHDNKLTLRAVFIAAGALAGGIAMVLLFLDNRVAAQTDAGIKGHENRIVTLEQQRESDRIENNNRSARMELNQNADHGLILDANQKLDALLRAQGVHNPAPTPKDAGP